VNAKGISPAAAIVTILVVIGIAGGIYFLTTNPGAGTPGAGQAGRSDPTLSGSSNVMQRAQRPPARGGSGGMPQGSRPR
jgi:hypothetical protein